MNKIIFVGVHKICVYVCVVYDSQKTNPGNFFSQLYTKICSPDVLFFT